MAVAGFRLGVDLGTSNTAAALALPDGSIRPLLFDGSPQLPSAVFAGLEGLLVGRDAEYAARVASEADRVAGAAVTAVTLAHPAGWGPVRRNVLRAAVSSGDLRCP